MASLADVFLHDWIQEVILESSWRTFITSASSNLGEQRRALADKPYRMLTARWNPRSQSDSARLLHQLYQLTDQELVVPLHSDLAKTTGTSSGSTINCPTADRRFFVGSKVVIVETSESSVVQYEVATIGTVNANSLDLSAPLSGSFPAGSVAYPAMGCRILLSPRPASFLTNRVANYETSLREVPGSTALPPLVAAEALAGLGSRSDPDGNGTYPIFSKDPDWSSPVALSFSRPGDESAVGLGYHVEQEGSASLFICNMTFVETSRSDALQIARFVDGRRGRLLPFWLPWPVEFWSPVGVGTTFIDVSPQGNYSDLAKFYAISILRTDGTLHVLDVSSTVDNTSSWRINFSPSIPAILLADVRRASPASFVRLGSDALKESWITDQVMSCQLSFVEVLNEASLSTQYANQGPVT